MPLRTKFILLSALLVTVVMVTVTYFFTIQELNDKRAAAENQIQRMARNIATMKLLDRQDWTVYQNYISQLMAVNKDIVYIAIFDDRATLRAHALNSDLVDVERPVASRRVQAEIVRMLDAGSIAEESRGDLQTERVNILVGERVLGSVHVGFSLIHLNRELQNGILFNVVLALIFILLFTGLSVLISRRLTRPLERLNAAMDRVAQGDLEQRVTPTSRDEIAQLTRTFNEMVEDLRERKIIEDLGIELRTSFQLQNLAELVRNRLAGAIGAGGAEIFIRSRKGQPQHFYWLDGSATPSVFITLNEFSQRLLIKESEGILLKEAPEDIQQAWREFNNSQQTLLIPMAIKGELFGLLLFDGPEGRENFNRKQRHFASILAGQAAFALENSLLYERVREQERLQRELEIAREVQQRLLPARMPDIPGFQLDGVCRPAREVGGDYFDFFHLDDHRWGVLIADVSGKGTSASFYMAEIKGMMTQLTSGLLSPRAILSRLNSKLYQNVDRRVFVTMIYGILDTEEKQFTYARAGHNALLKMSGNGSPQTFTPPGIGLGLESGKIFDDRLEERSVGLKEGEYLLLYTDGVVEAMNSRNEPFGEKQLLQFMQHTNSADAASIRQKLMDTLADYTGEAMPSDDITIVVVRRSENPSAVPHNTISE
ncbi:MAG: SpoIIE family protein phosphatase [Calditrichia bacterium]